MTQSLTIRGAADRLGTSERTIRRMIADGSLPAYRVGARLIRIRESDLDALMRPIEAAGGAQ